MIQSQYNPSIHRKQPAFPLRDCDKDTIHAVCLGSGTYQELVSDEVLCPGDPRVLPLLRRRCGGRRADVKAVTRILTTPDLPSGISATESGRRLGVIESEKGDVILKSS